MDHNGSRGRWFSRSAPIATSGYPSRSTRAVAKAATLHRDRRLPPIRAIALTIAAAFACDATAGISYLVTTNADPDGPFGSLSLRRAVEAANRSSGNTVQFDAGLSGSTISLASGEIAISQPMQVIGPGSGKLTITGNDASRIFKVASTSTATEVAISGLTLTHGYTNDNFGGGAVVFDHCDSTLSDVRITDSHSTLLGGGISVSFGFLQLIDSVVSGNGAIRGGGIALGKGKLTLEGSSVSYNSATHEGGGIYAAFYSNMTIAYSTISGNTIPAPSGPGFQGGGAIYDLHSVLQVTASTVAQNYAYDNGGGIYLADDFASNHAQISRSTIASNGTCCYTGGNGIRAVGGMASIDRTIVANDGNRNGLDDLAGAFNVTGSIIRNPGSAILTGSTTSVGLDPKLGLLGYHGGSRRTMLPDAGSPALDVLAACGSIDQRGYPRCVNGADDIGAVERQGPEIVIFAEGFAPER